VSASPTRCAEPAVVCRWLGRLSFSDALALQEQVVAEKTAEPDAPDTLLLLEHEPVFTIGRTPDRTSLGAAARLPYPVVEINRGGQATYHGPGQLVGYPILDLKSRGQDLHRYLRALERLLLETSAAFGVKASRRAGLTGAWAGDRKLASIGVGVRRWISMHGFALNVCGTLDGFAHIVPCGLAGVEMTSLERESGTAVTVEEAAAQVMARAPRMLAAPLPEEAEPRGTEFPLPKA
jgi:lipoyl(octanoyl) transferase